MSAQAGVGRSVRVLGGLVALLAFAWVLRPIVLHFDELRTADRWFPLLATGIPAALAYAALGLVLASAWWWLSRIYGERIALVTGWRVFALAQWTKYLPGNVIQYASRQLLGRQAGWGHATLVASSVLELASLLVAAVLWMGAASIIAPELQLDPGLMLAAAAVALGALFSWPLLDRIARRTRLGARALAGLPSLSPAATAALFGLSVPVHALFFLGAGALFYWLALAGWGAAPSLGHVVAVYAAAWTAGTLAVGAPAGAGVREALLVLGLQSTVGAAGAATLAIALRLVTTLGDLLLAGGAWLLSRPSAGARPRPDRSSR